MPAGSAKNRVQQAIDYGINNNDPSALMMALFDYHDYMDKNGLAKSADYDVAITRAEMSLIHWLATRTD